MRNIDYGELHSRFTATQGKLSHLKTMKGRRRKEYSVNFHDIGDPFIRDKSVIVSSKAWRRMGAKNQVASSPLLPHVRNRATHVGEVRGHAGRMADHLGLNVHLVEAIADGHDIGHFPFGHQGEHYIKARSGMDITHEVMGVIMAQHIERRGEGLNLTFETLDGIYRHSGKNVSPLMTQEAWVVRYADKIAYLFSDFNDFTRLGWICDGEVIEIAEWFGKNQRERTFRTMVALYEESAAAGKVVFEQSEPARAFSRFRTLMYKEYERVAEQDVARFLDPIYDFLEKSGLLPPWLGIAFLTDEEVCRLGREHRVISSYEIASTGLGEILRLFEKGKLFDIKYELDLDW